MSPRKKQGGTKPRKKKKALAKPAKQARRERGTRAQARLGLTVPKERTQESASFGGRDEGGTSKESEFNFSEFFERVGQGLVDAQRKMDAESLVYLKEVAVQPHVLPSIFRIPKLKANVKFGLTEAKGNTVGIIFYKDETKEQTLNQQSVEFDIVSVPAPLELNAPLGVNLVLSKAERNGIFDRVKSYRLPGVANTQAQLGLQAALNNPDGILIYAPTPGGGLYLAYADNEKNENVGFWFVSADPTQVLTIRKFGEPGGPGLLELRNLVAAQGTSQVEFLKRTRV